MWTLDNNLAALFLISRPFGSGKELNEQILLAPLYCGVSVISEFDLNNQIQP